LPWKNDIVDASITITLALPRQKEQTNIEQKMKMQAG